MSKYNYNGEEQFRPLSPWAYFGYQLLFAIPIVGLICLIIFSLSSGNINRRNFARSYFCVLIISIAIAIIMIASGIGASVLTPLFSTVA